MDTKTQPYLCKFDSAGRRTETLLACEYSEEEKAQKIADGYIEIDEDEWSYYVGNKGQGKNGTGYVRGKDGKPTDAPAYVPTKAEKLAALDSQYDADKAKLAKYFTDAVMTNNTMAQSEIRQELDAISAKYDSECRSIEKEA